MRIAIVSDIHGNRTAFEAVLADLRQTAPDLILHGGDLCHAGASPAEIVDRIRELGWQGVVGNTDEMLYMPESLEEFAKQAPKLQPLITVIREMGVATREALGEERLAWLLQTKVGLFSLVLKKQRLVQMCSTLWQDVPFLKFADVAIHLLADEKVVAVTLLRYQ